MVATDNTQKVPTLAELKQEQEAVFAELISGSGVDPQEENMLRREHGLPEKIAPATPSKASPSGSKETKPSRSADGLARIVEVPLSQIRHPILLQHALAKIKTTSDSLKLSTRLRVLRAQIAVLSK